MSNFVHSASNNYKFFSMNTLNATATLRQARQFNANGNQEVSSKQVEVIENNVFLRNIIAELDSTKSTSPENVTKLKNVFSSLKNFKCMEKYLYEVTISLGMTRKPEFVALAREFNTILNDYR